MYPFQAASNASDALGSAPPHHSVLVSKALQQAACIHSMQIMVRSSPSTLEEMQEHDVMKTVSYAEMVGLYSA